MFIQFSICDSLRSCATAHDQKRTFGADAVAQLRKRASKKGGFGEPADDAPRDVEGRARTPQSCGHPLRGRRKFPTLGSASCRVVRAANDQRRWRAAPGGTAVPLRQPRRCAEVQIQSDEPAAGVGRAAMPPPTVPRAAGVVRRRRAGIRPPSPKAQPRSRADCPRQAVLPA